jgi:hypothetical protein
MWERHFVIDARMLSVVTSASAAVLPIAGAADHPKYPAALVVTAWVMWGNDPELARRQCDEARLAEQRLGTEPSSRLWIVRSYIASAQGRTADAIADAEHAVTICRARGDTMMLVNALAAVALARVIARDTADAIAVADEIVALTRRIANPHVVESCLSVAAFALGSSDPERGLALAREALALTAPGETTVTWAIAADLADRSGHRRAALEYFAKAIDTFHWLGLSLLAGPVLVSIACILAERDAEAAAVLHGAGRAAAPEFARPPHNVEAEKLAIEAIDAALGATRRLELSEHGASMSEDDAVAYALDAINRALQHTRE